MLRGWRTRRDGPIAEDLTLGSLKIEQECAGDRWIELNVTQDRKAVNRRMEEMILSRQVSGVNHENSQGMVMQPLTSFCVSEFFEICMRVMMYLSEVCDSACR